MHVDWLNLRIRVLIQLEHALYAARELVDERLTQDIARWSFRGGAR